MNERIEQLAEQCVTRKFYVDHASEEFDYKKFAELIVKECASAVNSRDDSDTGFWANIIKEHFGVEEK
jgi:hypothetical protein